MDTKHVYLGGMNSACRELFRLNSDSLDEKQLNWKATTEIFLMERTLWNLLYIACKRNEGEGHHWKEQSKNQIVRVEESQSQKGKKMVTLPSTS